MGGKQKRAAKYKKWIESQNKLKGGGIDNDDKTDSGDSLEGGSGVDGCPGSPKIPMKVRYEVLRHRQKKRRPRASSSGNWLFDYADRINKVAGGWPGWPMTMILMLVMYVGIFFLIRALIAIFSVGQNVDRAALYNGVKNVLPGPVYKFIRVVDYLFTSRELSVDGVYEILFPDYYYNNFIPQQRHYDMDP